MLTVQSPSGETTNQGPPWIYTQYTKRSHRHIKDTVTCVRIWWIMETLDRLLICYYLTQKTKKAEHLLHHYVWDLEEGTELPFLVHHHNTWKQGQDHHTYFTTKRLGRGDRIATYFTTMRLGRGDRIATLTSVLWDLEEGTELPHLLYHYETWKRWQNCNTYSIYDSFSLYIAVSHMAHILVYYTLLVVIIICIMFVKLRKCWRML